ncbi:hypothetical protein KIN20_005040 [Parelaphostrongylus tenuis]|uniref:Uncharacterized protein n=1 Tax=Parelaphostrongylus tenuis TaxID=148309 RepID=A0AAD5QFM9_PARTN|nr:hypothetical protein KIN20_005040 [Parelaphostrongylus tenuis]
METEVEPTTEAAKGPLAKLTAVNGLEILLFRIMRIKPVDGRSQGRTRGTIISNWAKRFPYKYIAIRAATVTDKKR